MSSDEMNMMNDMLRKRVASYFNMHGDVPSDQVKEEVRLHYILTNKDENRP